MRIGLCSLPFFVALLGLCAPLGAQAATAPPAALHATATASPSPAANVITLYSEPGLRGRYASYRKAAVDVERQGFVARSAVSTGMWTLCEGGEVVSRCQTVDGQAPELKFAPQLVRPGLNALALYDQPGLKGRRIIYSFSADRPAPFHARSARTWGGPWSLCDRDFERCQTIDGRTPSIDLVVGAVRPEPDAVQAPLPDAAPVTPVKAVIRPAAKPPQTLPVSEMITFKPAPALKARPARAKSPFRPAMKPPRPLPVSETIMFKPAPALKARPARAKAPPADKMLHPPRLVRVAAPLKAALPPRHLVIQLTDEAPPHHRRAPTLHVRGFKESPPVRAIHWRLLTPVRAQAPRRHDAVARHVREARLVRYERPVHHAVRGRLVHMVSDRTSRRAAHAPKRRLYRHVHMMWGGPDPYLYAYEPPPPEFGPRPW